MNSLIKKLKEFFSKNNIKFKDFDQEGVDLIIYPTQEFDLGKLIIILNDKTEIEVPIVYGETDDFEAFVSKSITYDDDLENIIAMYNFYYENSEEKIILHVCWDEEKGEYIKYQKIDIKHLIFLKDIKAIKFTK